MSKRSSGGAKGKAAKPASKGSSKGGSKSGSAPSSRTGSLEGSRQGSMESLCSKQFKVSNSSYMWNPSVTNVKQIEYVRKLECELEQQQSAYLNLTAQFARLQFRLRQLMQAQPMERSNLLKDLERIAFQEVDAYNQCKPEELPRIEKDNQKMGPLRYKQSLMVCRQRNLIGSLRKVSDCLQTEFNVDAPLEHDQSKVCSPIEGLSPVRSVKSSESIKKQDSVKSSESIKKQGSVKSNDSIKKQGSVKSNDSIKKQGSVKSNDSIKKQGSVKSSDSIKKQGSAS